MRRRQLVIAAVAVVALALALLAVSTLGEESAEPAPEAAPTDSVACGARDGASGTFELTQGDRTWSYQVHLPAGVDDEPVPVVYLLHGLGGSAGQMLYYTAFEEVADEHGFAVVAPQANGTPTTWDVVTPASQEGSDMGFLRELTETVPEGWCVDGDRQYAAGLSNGSAAMFSMMCDGSFDIAAYGAVAATFYVPDRCADAPPASFVYFHGTADRVVPFDGGETPLFPVEGVETVLPRWAEHDGCDPGPASERIDDDVVHRTWSGCDDARLEAYVVEGGGHTWPGATAVPWLGPTSETVAATDVMVDFFDLD